MTNSTFRIQGSILNAVATYCAPQKDSRYYLHGVHVSTPSRSVLRLQATDGHTLIRLDMDGWNGPEVDQILPIPKLSAKAQYTFTPSSNGEQPATLEADSETRQLAPIDGRYPHIDKVIPPGNAAAQLQQTLDARYVARAAKAVQTLCKALDLQHEAMRIKFSENSPAQITVSTLPGLLILIMPMRD